MGELRFNATNIQRIEGGILLQAKLNVHVLYKHTPASISKNFPSNAFFGIIYIKNSSQPALKFPVVN